MYGAISLGRKHARPACGPQFHGEHLAARRSSRQGDISVIGENYCPNFDDNDIVRRRMPEIQETSSCFCCECFLPDLIRAVGFKIWQLFRPGPQSLSESDQKRGWRAKRRKRADSRRFRAMRKKQERGEGLGLILGTPTDSPILAHCAPSPSKAVAWSEDMAGGGKSAGRPCRPCPPYPCSDDDQELECSGWHCFYHPPQISMPAIPGSSRVYGDDTP